MEKKGKLEEEKVTRKRNIERELVKKKQKVKESEREK